MVLSGIVKQKVLNGVLFGKNKSHKLSESYFNGCKSQTNNNATKLNITKSTKQDQYPAYNPVLPCPSLLA
ncbi:hypothetical protein N403_00080 [Helicobacter pylori FD430]|nr:hypothetical protein N403_00080 [Helicobacter pylori FD430]